jgi:alanyl aminopeptidase
MTNRRVGWLAAFCLAGCVQAADEVPLGRLPRTVTPEHVAIELRMDPQAEGFSGRTRIDVDINEVTGVIWLHGRHLDFDKATITLAGGEEIPLKVEVADEAGGVLKLTAPAMLAKGKARLAFDYHAKYDQQLQGAYQVKVAGESYVMSQMEPLGARSAFPGFDEPAFKTPWDVTLVVPETAQAFANTAEVGREKVEDGWQKLRYATTENLPSYLIAFAVGPWDVVRHADIPPNAVRKTPLPLRGIASKGRGKEMAYALDHTAEIVAALEAYFGSPYPFDKLDLLAAPDYSFGAMENAGLIVYRETLMLGVENAPTLTRQGYWGTHTHELAHQWFGNLVTMPWWDDIWLNEAFATWMASKIVFQLKPEFHSDRKLLQSSLGAMGEDSLASTRRIHEPVHAYTDVISAFDGITYQKGGAVLSMFESYLGEDKFRDAVRMHLRKFARGSATSLDLMRSLAAQTDRPADVQAAFASFTDLPGVPFLRTDLACGAGQKPTLTVRQHRYLPLGSKAADGQSWGIPLCVRYPQGDATRKQCELIDGAASTIELETDACPAWLHPNADGAGYYRFAVAADDQAALDGAFGQFNEREQRVYADSLSAALRNGSLTVAQYLAALPRVVASDAREVAMSPSGNLEWLWEHGVTDDAGRAGLQRYIEKLYQPRLDALGLDPRAGETDEARLLRQALVVLLSDTARVPALRRQLAQRGRKVLGLGSDGALHVEAVDSDQRGQALAMAGALGGAEEFDAMEKHFRASVDQQLRSQLLTAMGLVPGDALQRRARALVLDPAVKAGEVGNILFSQLGERTTRAPALAWYRANFEAVFAKAPQVWQASLPAFETIGMCSEAEAVALHARYYQRMSKVEGGPRGLAQAEEEVRLCDALRARHAGTVPAAP